MVIPFDGLRYLVVGAGIFGCTVAEHIARLKKQRVLVIDRRNHTGGNCFSESDPDTGIEVHVYGTHIFHTDDEQVWAYIRRFTEFNAYRHQVLTAHNDRVFQMPINLETINAFYGLNLRPYEIHDFLRAEIDRDAVREPRNLEETAINLIGRPLYEAFIRGYTLKQWGRDPRELPGCIIKRLPFRTSYDESYYHSRWQGIPAGGYAEVFRGMLDHPLIDVRLGVDYFDVRDRVPRACLTVYTGPLDRFFDFKLGRLEGRSLHFERTVLPFADYQGTAVMNHADPDVPFTRIHEPRHLHPERSYPTDKTVILREYPRFHAGEEACCYPINTDRNNALARRYLALRDGLPDCVLGGRLAEYKYYDMDQAMARAIDTYEKEVDPWVPRA